MDTEKAADSFEVEDWSNTRVKRCGFDIRESKNLDDDEKQEVVKLMKKFVVGEKADAYAHSKLTDLLDRAFVAPFGIKILEDFKKAALSNHDIRPCGNHQAMALRNLTKPSILLLFFIHGRHFSPPSLSALYSWILSSFAFCFSRYKLAFKKASRFQRNCVE
jgi:hypothetical protein